LIVIQLQAKKSRVIISAKNKGDNKPKKIKSKNGSGARVRGQSLTKYGRYPIHKEGKIRYSAQHRAKAFDF
jgi:hypothetical protein